MVLLTLFEIHCMKWFGTQYSDKEKYDILCKVKEGLLEIKNQIVEKNR